MRIEAHFSSAVQALDKALDNAKSLAQATVSPPGTTSAESPARPSPAAVPSSPAVPSAEKPAFTLSISAEGAALARDEATASDPGGASRAGQEAGDSARARPGSPEAGEGGASASHESADPPEGKESEGASKSAFQLTPEEQAQVRELQTRDAEVRAHESAHSGAGGALAGAPSYTYEQGPDGRQYAVGGEVPIQVQHGGSPQETLRNAGQVRAAALAPAQPSSADLSVAAAASSLEAQARQELATERLAELTGQPADGEPTDPEATGGRPVAAESPEPVELSSGDEAAREAEEFDPRVQGYGELPGATAESSLRIDLFG